MYLQKGVLNHTVLVLIDYLENAVGLREGIVFFCKVQAVHRDEQLTCARNSEKEGLFIPCPDLPWQSWNSPGLNTHI